MNFEALTQSTLNIRKRILDMSLESGASTHLGGGLSIVEILTYLYAHELNYNLTNPTWESRDRFILSKGHGVLGFYATLREYNFLSEKQIKTFMKNESELIAHPIMNPSNGIESSNGSLGHGLSFGVGLAWAAKYKLEKNRVFVLLGDGECNEGSIWEAAMSASQLGLDNLIAIVDINGLQNDGLTSEILDPGKMELKWQSFGWDNYLIDGNSLYDIHRVFSTIKPNAKPVVILANTVKGKGVDFMENNNRWHHNRLTKTQYDSAIVSLIKSAND